MISREEVIWLYRCFFLREPENDAVIEGHMHVHSDFKSAQLAFVKSLEFERTYTNLLNQKIFYHPEENTRPSVAARNGELALGVIVKNGSAHIEKTISSCLPIVSFVAIVDSLSTDNTIHIAAETLDRAGIKYQILSQGFVDFSTARNQVIALIPSKFKWILMLDADEFIQSHDYAKILKLVENAEVDAWMLPRYNFIDIEGKIAPVNYPDHQGRLFRNLPYLRFHGRVHESLNNVKQWGLVPAASADESNCNRGPHIHHLGLVDLSHEEGHSKSLFYAQLLKPVQAV